MRKGFTLIELILVMGIFSTLIGISTINLINTQNKTNLTATVNIFTTDLKGQQLRAMVGDGAGSTGASDYGVRFETTKYTMFRSSYGIQNFSVALPENVNVSTTFPNSQIVFLKGSGEIMSFSNGVNTVTFQSANNGSQKTVTINKYGVVTAIN